MDISNNEIFISNGISENRCKIRIETLKQMAKGIREGIQDNGIIRKFDIIDYYYYTELPILEEFYSILNYYYRLNKITTQEYYTIIRFISAQKNAMTLSNRDKFMDIKFIFGDRVITMEEKKHMLELLAENNIPINDITFIAAIRRYVKNIDIKMEVINEQDKIKKKKR